MCLHVSIYMQCVMEEKEGTKLIQMYYILQAKKIEEHERRKERKRAERELREKKERIRKAQEARAKAAEQAKERSMHI